jgi:hypothetical protein
MGSIEVPIDREYPEAQVVKFPLYSHSSLAGVGGLQSEKSQKEALKDPDR